MIEHWTLSKTQYVYRRELSVVSPPCYESHSLCIVHRSTEYVLNGYSRFSEQLNKSERNNEGHRHLQKHKLKGKLSNRSRHTYRLAVLLSFHQSSRREGHLCSGLSSLLGYLASRQALMDERQYSSSCDRSTDKWIKLFVTTNSKLQMAGCNALHAQILRCIAYV